MPLLFVGTPLACAWPCLTVNMVVFDTKDDKTEQGCYSVINWWC